MSEVLGGLLSQVLGEFFEMILGPFFKRRRAVSHTVSPEGATKRSRRRRKGQA